jgi:hypothetical protein
VTVEHIEVLVEEPSTEAALRTLLPVIIGDLSHEIYPYQCKHDLLAKLPARLAGYANWLPESWRIMVVVDRDDDDCTSLKQKLEGVTAAAGLRTRAKAGQRTYSVINRLAIEELEAWYFGDWTAVRAVYPRVPASIPRRAAYRNPDAIAGGTWEAFERIMKRAGYFETGLRKIEAARRIAAKMNPMQNSSGSFQALQKSLTQMKSTS